MSSTNNHPFLTAEYALGLLNLRETAQAHALLGSDDQAVISALKWEDRFLALADQLPPLEPPADLLLQIQTALGHDTTVPLRPSAVPPVKTASPAPAQPSLQKPLKQAPKPSRPPQATAPAKKTAAPAQSAPRAGFWSSLWLWRAIAVVLALALATAMLSPRHTSDSTTASSAAEPEESSSMAQPPAQAPAQLAAVLQAPGQSSTPGWIATIDRLGNLILTPKVAIEVPQDSAVYLWTRQDTEAPRLVAALSPNTPATVPASATGPLPAGQIFEITQEVREATPPQAPKGPILFIGRLVALN
ncbi:anti-sigma factor domain-containing protein [Eoetvoesiella caeni]